MKIVTTFRILLLLSLLANNAAAVIINIPADEASIQEGIYSAWIGDTVLVQPGTYYENIHFGYYPNNIVLASLFLTTGDTSYVSSTIIDGSSAGTVVTFRGNEDSTMVITGFTIQKGYANIGAGIYCGEYNGNSHPTINNNIITDNTSLSYGGGIYCVNYSNPSINNNTITDNFAVYFGGGIFCGYSDAKITANIISGNSCGSEGSGIYSSSCSPIIKDNTITDNFGSYRGGGIFCRGSYPQIINNLIEGNSSHAGGGIYCSQSSPIIYNNTISGNIATSENVASNGGGICCYVEVLGIISNNLINNNSADSSGGGISCFASSPSIINNTINDNSAVAGGGIHFVYTSAPTINNNTITGNNALNYGGGIYCWNYGASSIINNTLSGNSANYGAGIYCVGGDVSTYGYPSIINTILWANNADAAGDEIFYTNATPVFSYCNVQGGWDGVGNINIDPIFRNPTNNDFQIMAIECGDPYDSPCIDLGHPGIMDSTLSCGYGLGEQRSDMGADGGIVILALVTITGTVSDQDLLPISGVLITAIGTTTYDSSDAEGNYQLNNLIPDMFNVSFSHTNYCDTTISGITITPGETIVLNVQLRPLLDFQYLPGDVNMYGGAWPPAATGPDVTYLVNYFRGMPTSIPCPFDGFWASADANGDCNVIGSDVTKLVNVFRGQGSILYCVDYPPAWPPIPGAEPSGWPNCETPVSSRTIAAEGVNR